MARQAPMASLQSTKLQVAIDKARREHGARDILTRSQAALSDLVQEQMVLEQERDEIISRRDQMARQIIDLTLLHEKLDADADDIEALIASKRDAIHALEAKGVKLPPEDQRAEQIEGDLTESLRSALAPQSTQ